MERAAMARSGYGAWALCVVLGVVSLALLPSTLGQATTAGCPGDLSNKVTQFETQNLVCKKYSFPASNPYVIWALRDNATKIVSMVVSMPLSPNKWAGLAFSGDGQMPNSSALIATLSASGAPVIDQYSLNDRSQSAVVKGGKKIVFAGGPPEGYYDQGSTVYVSFQVDFAKSTAQPNFLLMAIGNLNQDGTPDYHEDNRAFFSASFVSGVVSGKSVASELEHKAKIHGSLQILGWGLLLPVGAMVARYARPFDPAWFYTHITLQLVGFACVIAGVVTGMQLADDIDYPDLPAHRALGFFLLVLAILQVLAVVLRPKKDAKVRKYWNWYHGGVGRLALILAVVNIFLGLHLGNPENDFKVGYSAILAIEIVAVIILEVLLWCRWRRQSNARGAHGSSQDPPAFQFGGSV